MTASTSRLRAQETTSILCVLVFFSLLMLLSLSGLQCATETGVPLHRVPALASSPKVTWHPSNYVIAYCGQTKPREGGPAPVAVISLFGPGL